MIDIMIVDKLKIKASLYLIMSIHSRNILRGFFINLLVNVGQE